MAVSQNLGTPPDMSEAQWIWSPDGGGGTGLVSYVRRKFTLAAAPAEATLLITADNGFELHVNNRKIAAELNFGSAWNSLERFRLDDVLTAGANVIAIRGDNLGGPGGVLAGIYVRAEDGAELNLVTDKQWLSIVEPTGNWPEPDHDDSTWKPAQELGKHGMSPWGILQPPNQLTDPSKLVIDGTIPAGPPPPPPDKFTAAPDDYPWPEGIVYVQGRVRRSPGQAAIWPIHASRAYFEYDTPAPSVSGHKILSLVPARPGVEPTLLLDAGTGLVSSPVSSYDGAEIIFSMVPQGEKHFHIYRMAADGSGLEALTGGPWQDYDPAYLPDGRIVFSSTRMGSREEYHANTSRNLWTLSADRRELHPLTYHIVADSEPEVTSEGRIIFVRHDNFMERAKVETHIHSIRPDGSESRVFMGPDRSRIVYDPATGAEDASLWLRNLGFGCPAPLPDGRVACISHLGLTISDPTINGSEIRSLKADITPFDISPMPDGRLLASTLGGILAIVDIGTGEATELLQGEAPDRHSVAYLGPRPKPPIRSRMVPLDEENDPDKSGFLLCQSVFDTQQTDGQWKRVRAMRVVQGDPLTLRPARHQYGHIGTVGVELGEVPLAPDGSFFVKVPADRPLFLQAIDAEGRPVVNEMSWIYVRPGETRSCIGCHGPRRAAPASAEPLAAKRPAIDLMPAGRPHRYRANNAANGGVLNLQFDRFRECASIDLYSPAPLGGEALEPARPAEISDLTATLQDGHSGAKRSALRRLSVFREQRAAPAIAAALSDREPAVRTAAALALGACGTRESVPALLDALSDSSSATAQGAHSALAHLTGHDLPFNAYDESQRESQAAAWREWLDASDWPSIEAAAVARLASEDSVDAHLAIESLGHVGGDAAKAALRAYLEADAPGDFVGRLAAIRALGHLGDAEAIPTLVTLMEANIGDVPQIPGKSHEFGWAAMPDHLIGAAAETLGRIGTPEAESRLIEVFGKLRDFWFYSFRTGDHEWLMGCHSSIPHYRILEALEALGSTKVAPLAPAILRSIPMDPDRGLLCENDAYEIIAARLLHRNGMTPAVVETCLSVLGDEAAKPDVDLAVAVTASPPAVSVGVLEPASRAAQLLSVVVLDPAYAPRTRAAFERYRAREPSRERSWTCFFLARALGRLRDAASVQVLCAALDDDPTEHEIGIPDPPDVFLHAAMTPLYRAAVADALGRIGDPAAYPTLLRAVTDYTNAMDVRQAAAGALAGAATAAALPELDKIADEYPEVVTQRTLWDSCVRIRDRSQPGVVAEGQ